MKRFVKKTCRARATGRFKRCCKTKPRICKPTKGQKVRAKKYSKGKADPIVASIDDFTSGVDPL